MPPGKQSGDSLQQLRFGGGIEIQMDVVGT
jgi:hypothetical protein